MDKARRLAILAELDYMDAEKLKALENEIIKWPAKQTPKAQTNGQHIYASTGLNTWPRPASMSASGPLPKRNMPR